MKLLASTLLALLLAAGAALAQTTLPYMGGTSGLYLQSNGTSNPPAFADPLASPTLSGTVTLPDGGTWTSAGLANSATISTASASFLRLTPTWTFTNLAGNSYAAQFNPVLTNTTGTVVAGIGQLLATTIGTSSQAFTSARVANVQLITSAGYTGTVTNGTAMIILTPSVLGTNPITIYSHLTLNSISNGNGITSGTVTNYGLRIGAHSAAAGSGGTVSNFGSEVQVPSGTGNAAGTTQNYGLYINGNGGTTGAGNVNYSLYNNSSAPSVFTGPITFSGTVTSGASAGLTCSGTPTSSFATVNGIVTHC